MMATSFLKKNIWKILFLIGVIYLLVDTFVGFTNLGLWYDELFSIKMIQRSFNDMIVSGIGDVHPFLYYLIFRGFFNIFNFFGFKDIVLIGIFTSLVPYYLLCLFNYFVVRKTFDCKVAGLFNLLIFSMPLSMHFSVEIRMYGWALLFITIAFVFVKKVLENNDFKNWMVLAIASVLGAYMHYFAAFAAVMLYLVLFSYIVIKNRRLIKNFIISSIVGIVCYIPGLYVLIIQITRIRHHFWLPPVSKGSIIDAVFIIFSPIYSPNVNFDVIFIQKKAVVLAIIMIIIFLYLIFTQLQKQDDSYVLIGLVAFVLVPFLGILISIFDTSVYYSRYIFPALGILWLCFSLLFNKLDNVKLKTLILIVILIYGVVGAATFIDDQNGEYSRTITKHDVLNEVISPNDIVISTDNATYVELSSYYLVNSTHYVVSNSTILELLDDLNSTKGHVFLIDNKNATHQLLVDNGFKIRDVGIGNFEWDLRQYEIYEISYS